MAQRVLIDEIFSLCSSFLSLCKMLPDICLEFFVPDKSRAEKIGGGREERGWGTEGMRS